MLKNQELYASSEDIYIYIYILEYVQKLFAEENAHLRMNEWQVIGKPGKQDHLKERKHSALFPNQNLNRC